MLVNLLGAPGGRIMILSGDFTVALLPWHNITVLEKCRTPQENRNSVIQKWKSYKFFKKPLSRICEYTLWILLPSSPFEYKTFSSLCYCRIVPQILEFGSVHQPRAIYHIREHSDRWNVTIGVQKHARSQCCLRDHLTILAHWWSASSHLSSSLHEC